MIGIRQESEAVFKSLFGVHSTGGGSGWRFFGGLSDFDNFLTIFLDALKGSVRGCPCVETRRVSAGGFCLYSQCCVFLWVFVSFQAFSDVFPRLVTLRFDVSVREGVLYE
jgi:hypothetical protein